MTKNTSPTTKKAPNYGQILAWVIVLAMVIMYLRPRIRFVDSQKLNDKNIGVKVSLKENTSSILNSENSSLNTDRFHN